LVPHIKGRKYGESVREYVIGEDILAYEKLGSREYEDTAY
jgi:hypothetical protein